MSACEKVWLTIQIAGWTVLLASGALFVFCRLDDLTVGYRLGLWRRPRGAMSWYERPLAGIGVVVGFLHGWLLSRWPQRRRP